MQNLDYLVYTDEKWAAFVLGQLLQNAARYRAAEPVITLSARSSGKQIQLTVQDNGIGIPAHELSRVFDRGFTGRPGSSRGGSTGMGLYLCQKLISLIFTATLLTEGSGLVISGIIRGRSMENASFDLYFGIEGQRPEPGIMVGASSPGSIIAVSLGLFFLIYAVYILLAYHSLKRNALP